MVCIDTVLIIMNLIDLKSEITNDPLSLGYASMQPEQMLSAMLASTSTRPRNIPLDELQALLMTTVVPPSQMPVWWVLKSAATSDPLAEMAFDLFSSRFSGLDPTLPFVADALTQLRGAGVIDQSARDAIDALAVETVNRGVLLFGRMPNTLEIRIAMSA